jgi:AraC-like DNA-binding protein
VEVVYMCEGETTHIVNGRKLVLKKGELLFLSQNATHAVCRAAEEDVAVNFIVLPDFFTGILPEMGEEETPLRRFLVDSLCGDHVGSGYLHFEIADIRPLQNLVENLLVILMDDIPNRQRLSQMTMSLLFMQLVGYTETLRNDEQEDAAVLKALQYIETNYSSCSLEQLAMHLHYSEPWLSREIKNKTGKNFTQLVQEKRLSQAAFLLKHTDRNVSDISLAVGYENISYFHRLFALYYGKSPRNFRMQERTLF